MIEIQKSISLRVELNLSVFLRNIIDKVGVGNKNIQGKENSTERTAGKTPSPQLRQRIKKKSIEHRKNPGKTPQHPLEQRFKIEP